MKAIIRQLAILVLCFAAAAVVFSCNSGVVEERDPSDDPWAAQDCSKRMLLTFHIDQVSETLQDFPLLVVLDGTRIDYGTFEPCGTDLRFFDAGENPVELHYEIEKWVSKGTDASFVWVKVPAVEPDVSTDYIWMYWDSGSTAVSPFHDPAEVWSEYELVYHLGNASGHQFPDATGNHTGTATSKTRPVTAMIGDGFRSSSSSNCYIDSGWAAHQADDPMNDYTVEAWVKGDTAPAQTSGPCNGPLMGHTCFNLGWDHQDELHVGDMQYCDVDNGWNSVDQGTLEAATWYYLAAVSDSSVPQIRTYRNGDPASSSLYFTGSYAFRENPNPVRIGSDGSTPMDGIIDEVRVSAQVRSDDWIKAQYLSMTDAFLDYNEVEELQ